MGLGLDRAIVDCVAKMRSPGLDTAFEIITLLGSAWTLVLLGLAFSIALWLAGRKARVAAFAIPYFVGIVPVLQVAKFLIGRERPPADVALIALPPSASFPSGHAFGTVLLVGLAGWATRDLAGRSAWRALFLLGCLLALLVGVSRVYLAVHWPTDVLGGWLLGLSWVAVATMAFRRYSRTD